MRLAPAPALLAALVAALLVAASAAPDAGAAVRLTQLGSFDYPVHVASPPGDPRRLFVVERSGRIMQIRDGVKIAKPLLDIRREVLAGGEEGLLSMAFAPDYRSSRKLYVYFTAARPGDPNGNVIKVQELATAPGNRDVVEPGSRRTLFTVDHPGEGNHNGGQLQFGPDGLLYAGTGDGGGGNDQGNRPPNNAQNLGSRLGKLLRIDPRRAGAVPQIYAYGLRNPWRFSFDRRTGALTIADVGQNAREEVNLAPPGAPAGANYGWVCFEGTLRNPAALPPCNPPNHVPPVLETSHADGYCAIVGGYVVRDPALTGLTGRYLYGDACVPRLRSAALARPPARSRDSATGLSILGLTSFGEDYCGHVYATSGRGAVYRIDGDAFRPCPAASRTARDRRAPRLRLGAQRRQRVLRRGGVRIALRCDETCGVTARATVRIGSKRYRMRTATRQLAAGKRARVRLRFKARGRRAVARALKRGRRVTIRVTAVARDAAGNRRTARRTVRARR